MARIIIHKKEAKTEYYIEDLGNEIKVEMISIPGGSFGMGTEDKEIKRLIQKYDMPLLKNERPQHKVNVPRFFMGRYPITQGQWRIVADWEQVKKELNPDPSRFKKDYEGINRWTRPVGNVSWEDAQEFCTRLSQKTGAEYRLPTEAEWEYACRGGTDTPFHFGETISTELANYNGKDAYGEGVEGKNRGQTTPVGYFKVANSFGLSEMHGNVREWCEDDWHENYEGAPTDGSAWLSSNSSTKVVRGGSWYDPPISCRSAYRFDINHKDRNGAIGFRVVCVDPRRTT